MQGPDAHALVQPPAPAFASRAQAAEISENYWMALLRDVPYSQYAANPIANAAAADLTLYGADFNAPKTGGAVTTATLFRGLTPGDAHGTLPLSVFLSGLQLRREQDRAEDHDYSARRRLHD